MKLLLPLILILVAAGGGIGLGLFLRPEPEPTAEAGDMPEPPKEEVSDEPPGTAPSPGRERPPLDQIEYTRLNNQFVVPVLDDGDVGALVVLSLSVETFVGARATVFAREPKLRDAFLQVLFDHANAGGFSHDFTAADRIATLRQALWEAARPVLGDDVIDVLITDIARQEAQNG
ncbi:MAG: flagellar basal body-associated protein FliL [Pseudomonadota bacterium]